MTKSEHKTLSQAELQMLGTDTLVALGVPPQDAEETARILTLADMMQLHTHGISRLLSYGKRLKIGGIDPRPDMTVEVLAQAIRRIDGGNGLGPLVGARALAEGIEAARATGIAIVFCRGSNHFGPIAPYAFLAAQQGFASIIGSTASVTIAPTGGREARLGNNPLGFGFPNPGSDPILLDMAMSVAARAKIRDAAKAGEPIPETWATGPNGEPTTDPLEALKGCLLPFGGHKGYGLSLCVDLMSGLLSGASYLTNVTSWVDYPESPQKIGHFFILLDTACLMPSDTLGQRMTEFSEIVHTTPPADPEKPVQLPGERELSRMRSAERDGIAIPSDVLTGLAELRT